MWISISVRENSVIMENLLGKNKALGKCGSGAGLYKTYRNRRSEQPKYTADFMNSQGRTEKIHSGILWIYAILRSENFYA